MQGEAKKIAALKEKTKKARQLFNLPESEDCIQGKGRLYVTQNYLSWASDITSVAQKIPFRTITEIKAARSLVIVSNAITVEAGQTTYDFSGFVHRDEAINLMRHVWKHPPTFVSTKQHSAPAGPSKREKELLSASDSGSLPLKNSDSGNSSRTAWGNKSGETLWGGGSGGVWGDSAGRFASPKISDRDDNILGSTQKQKLSVRDVDTASSENALRLAYETRNLGVDTMVELENQANQIDRIESKVENIHNNLDKGDRLLRGIESLGGHMYNGMTSQKAGSVVRHESRELTWKVRRAEKLDVPILFKHSNDLLTPAILHFEETVFSCIDEGQKKPAKGMTFSYDDVEKLVIRARPLHLDLRFFKTERFRLASSFIQAIVNEFYFRVPNSKVEWETEGGLKFDYGDEAIVISTKAREDGVAGGGSAFFGIKKSTADLLSDDVDEEVKQAVRQQESHLHEIGMVVGEMGQMSIAMGTELDRQNAQLVRVTDRVENANERMHNTNNRIDRI